AARGRARWAGRPRGRDGRCAGSRDATTWRETDARCRPDARVRVRRGEGQAFPAVVPRGGPRGPRSPRSFGPPGAAADRHARPDRARSRRDDEGRAMTASKAKRQSAILQLVNGGSAHTQHEIASALARRGMHATQATISRDIQELGLVRSGAGYRTSAAL